MEGTVEILTLLNAVGLKQNGGKGWSTVLHFRLVGKKDGLHVGGHSVLLAPRWNIMHASARFKLAEPFSLVCIDESTRVWLYDDKTCSSIATRPVRIFSMRSSSPGSRNSD